MSAPAGAAELAGRTYLRLILLGAAIGIPAALLAAGFLALVHELEDVLWHDLPDALGRSSPPWYLVIGLPVAGACLVAVARGLLPGDGGHPPLRGLGVEPTPVAYAPGIALAALGTLAFGSVLGPEAPLIALGSVVGVGAASRFAPGPREAAVLSTAGSFSASRRSSAARSWRGCCWSKQASGWARRSSPCSSRASWPRRSAT